MSDKTPGPSGAFDREDDALEGLDAAGEQTADGVEETPEAASAGSSRRRSGASPVRRVPGDTEETQAEDGIAEAEALAPGGTSRRRFGSAPIRRDPVDADADDAAIADLEGGFTPDEQAVAASVRRSTNAPVKKSVATRKRSDSAKEEQDQYTAKNPATFVKQSAGEIKKVVWPTWPQLTVLFFAVLIFVLFMIAFVGILDYLFGFALLALLGAS